MKRLILALFIVSASPALAQSKGSAAAIHAEIGKLVALYTDGLAAFDAQSRRVLFGPLFEADSRDAVAFFVLSGVGSTNGHEEYIAVFAQGEGRSTPVAKERPYRMVASAQIGKRWARTLNWETATIRPGRIVVRGMRWGSNDAGCCPTEPIEVTYSVARAAGTDTRYPVLQESERPLPPVPSSSQPPAPR